MIIRYFNFVGCFDFNSKFVKEVVDYEFDLLWRIEIVMLLFGY